MATDLGFDVVTQYPDAVFLGGTQTQDVTMVGYRTHGHGLYFEVPIPDKTYSAANVKSNGIGYTGTIESILDLDGIVGGYWTQRAVAGNALESVLVLTVESASGNSQATITVPERQWAPELVKPLVNKKVNALNAAENVTGA